MIKNRMNKHIDFNKLCFKNGISYCSEENIQYKICGKFSPLQLESAILVCDYYKEKHFCFIKCVEGTGIPDGYFNVLIEIEDWKEDEMFDIQYLVDNVYNELQKIK